MSASENKQIKVNVSLKDYTSWQVGGPADFFCTPQSLEELQDVIRWAVKNQHEMAVLGGGSNVLVSDQGFRGLVICMKSFVGLTVVEKDQILKIESWAGSKKADLLKVFLKYKLAPALFLAGLPGDAGGGVVMNAGVAEQIHPREFGEIVEWIDVLCWRGGDSSQELIFEVKRFSREQLTWSYRHSAGWEPGIIIKVGLSWPLQPDSEILEKAKNANRIRLQKQPLDMPSCGSVFINPKNHKAAQLIDSCQLKGFRIGDAQVSEKHANFIVNLGAASAEDIWQVIEVVKKTVKEKTNVDLTTEVVRFGYDPASRSTPKSESKS